MTAIILVLAIHAIPAAADQIRILTEVGLPAPGLPGVRFHHIEPPVINDSGKFAFFATLTGTGVTQFNDASVWLGDIDTPGSLRVLVREGDVAPGTEAGTTFLTFQISTSNYPVLNDAGEVAFQARLTGSAVTGNNALGLFVASPTTVRKVLRHGDLVPGATGELRITRFFSWTYSNAGVATHVLLAGTGVRADADGVWNDQAIVSGQPESLQSFISATPMPPPVQSDWTRAKATNGFQNPNINDSGQVSFQANLQVVLTSGIGSNSQAVLRGSGSSFAIATWVGQPSPVANYVVGPFSSAANSRFPFLANDGSVSLFSSLRCGVPGACPFSSLASVLVIPPSGGLVATSVERNAAPGTSLTWGSTLWQYPMATPGAIAIRGQLAGAPSGTEDYVAVGSASSVEVIVREGDAAPGTTGTFTYFDRPAVNARGDVAFVAGATGSSEGIWRHDARGTNLVVRASGDMRALGSGGLCRTIVDMGRLATAVDGTGGGDGQPRQFDDAGRVLFRGYSTETNAYAVFVAEPVDAISADLPIIHLNFEEAFGARSIVVPDSTPSDRPLPQEQMRWIPEESPVVPETTLSQADREAIVQEMQRMLCDSGVYIPVTLEAPTRTQNVVTVYFTPTVADSHCYRTGLANAAGTGPEIARFGGEASIVDRFNRINRDSVIVAVDRTGNACGIPARPNNNLDIAKLALHEVGHTFGLAHINPYFENPIELMDYEKSATLRERFTNENPASASVDMHIVEPPQEGGEIKADTHNPTYHLRVFGLGEEAAQVQSQGVMPGTWDIEPATPPADVEVRGFFGNLTRQIFGLHLRTINANAPFLDTSETEIRTAIANLGNFAGQAGTFAFDSAPGTRFGLIGSSQAGGAFDIYLQPSGSAPNRFTGLAHGVRYTGNVIHVRTDGTSQVIGTFNVRATDVTVDSDVDGIADVADNCTTFANVDQRDSDADGYGNRCDGDLNNDFIVNVTDQNLLRARFLSGDPHADLNGDGTVNSLDLGLFKALYNRPPGPSGIAP